jgi:hypothetical protein
VAVVRDWVNDDGGGDEGGSGEYFRWCCFFCFWMGKLQLSVFSGVVKERGL